jgi:hypothetical protein
MLVKGKSNDEEDDDPWRNISAGDLAAAINRALIQDREETPRQGECSFRLGKSLSAQHSLRLRLVISTHRP